jgi:hypothetical protein
MTSRKSSGSSRAASAVESTRSQNITVSCRRLGHSGRRSIGSAGSLGPERGDGIKQSPAMSDQIDVEILQIVGGQAGQQARIDLICAERRLVLRKPETAEPCRNVHARLPDAANAGSHRTSICRCARILDGLSQPRSCGSGVRHGALTSPCTRHRREGRWHVGAGKAPRHRHSQVRGKSECRFGVREIAPPSRKLRTIFGFPCRRLGARSARRRR